MIAIVTPITIGLLVGIAALVEFYVVSMAVAFPLAVISGLRGPHMVVVIIRIVNTRMNLAAGAEQRSCQDRSEQERSEILPKPSQVVPPSELLIHCHGR